MIGMAALRALYESLGLRDPQTYVQSGNVVFRAAERNLGKLADRLEEAIESRFGFRARVILRTAEEMRDVAGNNPFAARPDIAPARLLVLPRRRSRC
jgi:uncharacterized protein (DUF1697 family)